MTKIEKINKLHELLMQNEYIDFHLNALEYEFIYENVKASFDHSEFNKNHVSNTIKFSVDIIIKALKDQKDMNILSINSLKEEI